VKPSAPPPSLPVSPVLPRKLPKQQRSIVLVNALKDACLQILREEGPDALTVARLSEVSGVAVVSMYEYFPTVEAVTAAAFRAVIAQLMREHRLRMEAIEDTTLDELLLNIVTNSLAIRRELTHLHPQLYARYIEQFEVMAPEVVSDPLVAAEVSPNRFARALERYRDQIRIADMERAGYLALRALVLMTRTIALERPAYLDDPDTPSQIAGMLRGLLT
jgi:AcrR family transcriptional regulator